jgi:putative ABC transport system permease protein
MVCFPISNLTQKKTRTLVSVAAVSLGVALVIVLVGMTNGTLTNHAQSIENVGGDILFQPLGSASFLGLSKALMPGGIKNRLLEIKGIAGVAPVLVWNTKQIDNFYHNIFGIDNEGFSSIGKNLDILQGRFLEKPYDMVLDQRLVEKTGLKIGDKVTILNHQFTLVGICKPNVGAMIYLPISTMQEILGFPGKVSLFFIRCSSPQASEAVAEKLRKEFKGYQIDIISSYSEELEKSAVGLKALNLATTAVAMIASFLAILLAMYTAIIERTREIGILKAIGATRRYVIRNIVIEALIICTIGVFVGYLIAHIAKNIIIKIFPLLTVDISLRWMLIAGALGIVGGVLGSLYPAFRAAKQDPVDSLKYE